MTDDVTTPRGTTAPAGRGPWRAVVIDADTTSTSSVQAALRGAGLDVHACASAAQGLRLVLEEDPDVVLLEAVLPDGDGLQLCRQLRAAGSDAHVLILSGRTQVALKVEGLAAGADDYLVKPFAMAELMARLKAMLRRRIRNDTWSAEPDRPQSRPGLLVHGDLVVDLAHHLVRRADVEVPLTRTEFRLLEYFLTHPRETLTKERILRAVWGEGFTGSTNIVERYVGYLRQKLDSHGPPLIRTIRHVGYALRVETVANG